MYPELALQPTEFPELLGGIAVDAAGQVYIADAFNDRIRKVDAKGVIHTFFEETGTSFPWWPHGIAVDTVGSVYVTSQWHGSLVKFPVDGPIEVLAEGRWLQGSEGIALDPDGSVYVARACTIVKVRPISPISPTSLWLAGVAIGKMTQAHSPMPVTWPGILKEASSSPTAMATASGRSIAPAP